MLVEVQTINGPKKVRVCDYCMAVCTPSKFCSGRCAREFYEREIKTAKPKGSNP